MNANLNVYMDNGAAHPVDERVLEEMLPYFSKNYGNPASFHSYGFNALNALNESRERVSSLIKGDPLEIFFTSGATESNNLALLGFAQRNGKKSEKIVISAVEHISIINLGKELSKQGFTVTHCPVDEFGLIDLEKLNELVDKETLLVSVTAANGEVGTVQPLEAISEITHDNGAVLHTDATAAVGQIPFDVNKTKIDLMTISSNDLNGPKGAGALYLRKGIRVKPQMIGGGQEMGIRSGSENIPGIVGLGKAAELAEKEIPKESERLTNLRNQLIKGITERIKHSYLNGHPEKRLPNNANIRFSYIEGEALILSLDELGIQVSSGSACAAKTLEPSHVCLAMGLSHEEAHGSLVFTLGRCNNEEQVGYVIEKMPDVVSKLRAISPLAPKEL